MTPFDMMLSPTGLRFMGRTLPCTIGRGGVTRDKREGDGASPAGVWTITGTLYRPDRMAPPAPWAEPILPGELWCDDPACGDYNQPVRAPFGPGHEVLRRADPMYDIVLVTDWNADGVPGAGSAIFLHQWRRQGWPTAGCIAFRRDHLLWVAARAAPGTRVIVRPFP